MCSSIILYSTEHLNFLQHNMVCGLRAAQINQAVFALEGTEWWQFISSCCGGNKECFYYLQSFCVCVFLCLALIQSQSSLCCCNYSEGTEISLATTFKGTSVLPEWPQRLVARGQRLNGTFAAPNIQEPLCVGGETCVSILLTLMS